ncbi:MAG: ankyrin repeat domain-containing protein [Leptospira sp.]|nr:ankyrin repeat domain-containing protein [Leptospira sp.]
MFFRILLIGSIILFFLNPALFSQTKPKKLFDLDSKNKESVKSFYKDFYLRSGRVQNQWTGSIATCSAGENSKEYTQASLKRINFYRILAGLSPIVELVEEYNRKALQSSLIMEAANKLSHYPSSSWKCFSPEGKEGAENSNLALEPGTAGIDSYIEDQGPDNYFVGHRRWILFPQLLTMGSGSTKSANSLWVFGERSSSNIKPEFVAWPPEGYVPADLFVSQNYRWSFSKANADFSKAKMSLVSQGKNFTTIKEKNMNGAGDNTLVWRTNLNLNGVINDLKVTIKIENVLVGGEFKSYQYDVIFFQPFSVEELSQGPSETIQTNPDLDFKVTTLAFGGDLIAMKRLLESGGNPNAIQPTGWSALLIATSKNQTHMAKLLVLYGAEIDFTLNGWTPLKFANYYNNTELIQFFEEYTKNGKP